MDVLRSLNSSSNWTPVRNLCFQKQLSWRLFFFTQAAHLRGPSSTFPFGLMKNSLGNYFPYDLMNPTWVTLLSESLCYPSSSLDESIVIFFPPAWWRTLQSLMGFFPFWVDEPNMSFFAFWLMKNPSWPVSCLFDP